jgi:hypothetical protein
MEIINNLESLKSGDMIKIGDDIAEIVSNSEKITVKFKNARTYKPENQMDIEKVWLKRTRKLRKKPFSTNSQYLIFRLTEKEKNVIVCEEIFKGLAEDER